MFEKNMRKEIISNRHKVLQSLVRYYYRGIKYKQSSPLFRSVEDSREAAEKFHIYMPRPTDLSKTTPNPINKTTTNIMN